MRRSLKITAWVIASIALLLALVIGTVLIVGNTAAGRVQIEGLVARLTGGTVQLSGLAGAFPSSTSRCYRSAPTIRSGSCRSST